MFFDCALPELSATANRLDDAFYFNDAFVAEKPVSGVSVFSILCFDEKASARWVQKYVIQFMFEPFCAINRMTLILRKVAVKQILLDFCAS